MLFRTAKLAQMDEFDDIIDVRTPAEFAEDHLPGAINCPVLTDEERIIVGTLYKQESPFAARKVGAAMVAKNIAHHLENVFHDHPKSWRPLIYCWRGGQRSGAMCIILAQVGWAAHKLEGGYKTYRHEVLAQLEQLPATLIFRVICGATGSGKTRLLDALASEGVQVLDLETLARHRGSVLGQWDGAQPSQRWFDTCLWQTLRGFDSARPVFVEAESNRIGRVGLPPGLVNAMHQSACVLLDTTREARIALLLEEYRHFLDTPGILIERLQALHTFHGTKRLQHWEGLIREGAFHTLVDELLALHYDPGYLRSQVNHFVELPKAGVIAISDAAPEKMRAVARGLLEG